MDTSRKRPQCHLPTRRAAAWPSTEPPTPLSAKPCTAPSAAKISARPQPRPTYRPPRFPYAPRPSMRPSPGRRPSRSSLWTRFVRGSCRRLACSGCGGCGGLGGGAHGGGGLGVAGGSAAMNCVGAVHAARRLGPGHTIVTVLCDSGARYMSTVHAPAAGAPRSRTGPARRP